jgi:hypothetical protein
MDESGVASANLDQTEQDFLTPEIPDEIVEAAAEDLNVCRPSAAFRQRPSHAARHNGSPIAQLICMPAIGTPQT